MKDVYVKFVNGMDVKYSNVKAVLMGGDDWDVELKFDNSLKIHINKGQILFIETIDSPTSLGEEPADDFMNEPM